MANDEKTLKSEESERIWSVPLGEIEVGEENVRHSRPERNLEELADGIEALGGLLQPIVLSGTHGKPPYKLIAGKRRFLAHEKILKKRDPERWGKIRAVFERKVGKFQAALRSLAENIHRAPLDRSDAARAVTELYRHYGRDEQKVKAATGMSIRTIREYVEVEERASEEMKRRWKAGNVTLRDLKRALRAAGNDIRKAERILERIEKEQPPGYQKDRLVEYGEANPTASVDDIWSEAQRPRVERSFSVRLPEAARKGLERAARQLAMDPREVVEKAIGEWLSEKGFTLD